MDDIQARARTFERTAWGAFCVWWEIADMFEFLFSATWVLGFGLILIALNAARARNDLPTSGFTITFGSLAFVWGGLATAESFLDLPFEPPVLPILLILLGVIVLAGNLTGKEIKKQEA